MPETPMVKQYQSIKAQHRDIIVFFRMGDFYEMFYEDAEIASKVLGIALTSRNKGENAMPMAGVPAKAMESYLQKLLEKQLKIAICEQTQDPKEAQGLVERNVVRIITPGTLTEQEVLYAKGNNFLLSVCILLKSNSKMVGLAWTDISTGQFWVHEIDSLQIYDEISRIAPAECLISEEARDYILSPGDNQNSLEKILQLQQIPITTKPKWYFDPLSSEQTLREHFQIQTLESYGCIEMKCAIGAAGALLKYLNETQKTSLRNLERIEVYNASETMFLDRATRHCLEIQRTMREGSKKGTLLEILDKTCTAMGARLLMSWISTPLVNIEKIQQRQEGIQVLYKYREINNKIRSLLEKIQDIERLCSRVAYQRVNARDLLAIKNSLQILPDIQRSLGSLQMEISKEKKEIFSENKEFSTVLQDKTEIENFPKILADIYHQISTMDELANLLDSAIHPDPEVTLKDGNIIKDGYSKELDELRSLQRSDTKWRENFQKREIQRTNIPTLKIGYTSVFGYYIEVTNSHSHKIPDNYIRKQTLKNAERYITPELKEYEEKALTACQRANALEYQLFLELREKVSQHLPELQKIARAIACLDVLSNLSYIAIEYKYVCPEMLKNNELEIIGGRHPVLSASKPSFVPNDIKLGIGKEIAIITGPNMAGKSTYIRQVALLILMAQIGSFIPCEKAKIGIVDRIFTRIGAADEISRDRSTFMVEMIETANILNRATEKSFIALDEVGRGTSTFDGISLAWAIMEHIQKKIKARTVFATHYHEMAELAEIFPNVHNYNVAVQERGEEITFLYKIMPGSADKSYGIHVARLAGIPKEVLKRGKDILANLQKHSLDFQTYTKGCLRINNALQSQTQSQTNLFSFVGEQIITMLANIEINNLSPIEAFQILNDLHNEAKKI